MNEELRFPAGRFTAPEIITEAQIEAWIEDIAGLPAALRQAVESAGEAQLGTPYRPGGWTLRQVVHHLADSHMNSLIRIKLALTEAEPVIKPYREELWAELTDTQQAPISLSLSLLDALHARWALLLRSLSPEDRRKAFLHPDNGLTTIEVAIGTYAWHGRHHLAHIRLITG